MLFRSLSIGSIFLMSLILSSCNSQKQQEIKDVTTAVIVTPVPMAKETVAVPVGYATCYTVKAGFYKHMWIPDHRVCEYTNVTDTSKAVWVDGYWMCTRYDLGKNECNYWLWKKAHWSSLSITY